MNSDDQCPNTPANTAVDQNGCELVDDTDGDGVLDDDLCPDTPPGTPVDPTAALQSQSSMPREQHNSWRYVRPPVLLNVNVETEWSLYTYHQVQDSRRFTHTQIRLPNFGEPYIVYPQAGRIFFQSQISSRT